jgi:hypothetical protein
LAVIGRCLHADPEARYANAKELAAELSESRLRVPTTLAEVDVRAAVNRPGTRFWWEFHQAVTALAYSVIVVPAWYARGEIGGWQGRMFFIALVTAVVVATAARLHLWFYPGELEWVYRRSSRWIRVADWLFAATLVIGGVLIGDERSPLAIVLPSVAVGVVVAFLLIEPVTARDAFKRSGIAS